MRALSEWVLLLVLAPVLAAVIGLPAGRRSRGLAVGCGVGGATVALLAALALAWGTWSSGRTITRIALLGPVDTGSTTVGLELRVDALAGLVAVAVTAVALAVQVYSAGYLRPHQPGPDAADDPPVRYAAYAATVSLFTAAMLLVVQADDLLLLLIGWEVMGLCSYLLIGHHSERPAARRAALQAFLVTRVGDVGFLLGIVALYAATGTTSISSILGRTDSIEVGTATVVGLLLLAGVVGKSAQFPLHGWLPDAMEGPTPVSALIHAATMVAAGVVVLARLAPLLERAPAVLATLAVITAVTMVGAALAALAAEDIKRALAWSTVSQVAIMLAALALGSDAGRAGSIAHLLSHAAFKSLLFLAAGVLVHHAGTTLLRDIHSMGRVAPWTSTAWGIGLVSLAALPPFAGFVSKEGILTAAEHAYLDGDGASWQWVAALVLGAVGLTTLLTGVYAARLFAAVVLRPRSVRDAAYEDPEMVFAIDPDYDGADLDRADLAGAARAPEPRGAETQRQAPTRRRVPVAMAVPVAVLTLAALAVSTVPLLGPRALADFDLELVTGLVGTFLALVGVLVGLSGGRAGSRDISDRLPPRVRASALSGYGYARAQDVLVVRPVMALGRLVHAGDRSVVEGYVQAPAVAARWLALGARRVQTGVVTGYLSWVAVGAVLLGVTALLLTGEIPRGTGDVP